MWRGNSQYGNSVSNYLGTIAAKWANGTGVRWIGLACDLDAATVTMYENGNVRNTAASGQSTGVSMYPLASIDDGISTEAGSLVIRTLASEMLGSIPSGYTAWAETPPLEPVFVGYGEQALATGPVSVPGHAAGDLLVAFIQGSSTSVPALPSGWTNIGTSGTTSYTLGWRLCYKVDTDNSIATLTGFGTVVWCAVWSSAAVGAFAVSAEALSSTNGNVPALTLGGSGGSHVMASLVSNQGYAASAPSGMTLVGDGLTPNIAGGKWFAWREGPVSSWSAKATSWSGGAFFQTWSLEILPN